MGYDYSSAIEAGLTDSQIAEFLSQEYGNYNIEAARQAGLSDTQIAQFLSQYELEQEEDKNIFDHVGDFLGGVGTGIASTPLLAAEGAAGLAYAIAPDLFPSIEESDVVEFSRAARQDVQAFIGGDAQSDAYGVGNALGSFATFLIPGVGGAALAAKGLAATGKGLASTGKALTATGKVVGWGGTGTLAVGAGAGEQVESILAAQERFGKEIPELDKRLSIIMGGGVGLTEIAPLRIPLGMIAAKLSKKTVTAAQKNQILRRVGNVFLAGGAEGAQEAIAGVLQDLISKNMYDPNLEIGESWASDLGYGGSAGAIFQGILQATIGRRGQKAPGQIDTVVGDPKDTVVAEDAPETILEESRRLSQLALPAPPPVPLQIEDHSIDSDRVMEPDADIPSIAQQTVNQLAGDIPVAFTNGQIALDTDGMPVSYEVASGDKGPYVKTRAGIKVSPYFATVEQAEVFRDEMNAGVFDIMRMHDQTEQDTLAREALKEAKIEETEATLEAARKTYLPAAIEFDTLPTEVSGRINTHNLRVGKSPKHRGDFVSVEEMADAGIDQNIIDGILPGATNTGTIEGIRKTASQKNIIIDSEASSQTGTHDDGFVRFVYGLTGGKDLNRMSGAQLATVQMKLDELPSFSQPTSLPTIRQPDFTPSQYATVIAMARDMPRRTVGKKGGRVLEKGEFQKSDVNNVLDKTGEPTEQIIERALRRGDIRHATNARGKQKRGVYRYNRPAPVKTPLQRGELIEAQERARAQEEAARTAEEGTIPPLRERFLRGGSIETTGEGAVAPKSGILIRRSDTDSRLTSEQAAQEMKNRASRAQAIPQFKERMENLGGREAINKALGSTLRLFQNKIPALKNVPLTVRYVNTLTEEGVEGTPEGRVRQTDDKQVIVLALDALEDNQDGSPPSREQALKQLSSVMSHEIIHVLKNAGIISKAEWKVLTDFVKTKNAVTREGEKLDKTWFDEISQVYRKAGVPLTSEQAVEEAVAESFRAYADGVMKVAGKPRNLFNRIADFFIAMRRGFKKINVLSAADVFGKYAPVPASTEFVPAGVTPTQEQTVTAQETRERLRQREADAPITQFSIKRERVRPRDTAFAAFNEGNNNLTLNGRPIPPKGKIRRLSAVDILYNDELAPRSGMSVPFAAEFLDMKGLRVHKKPILIEKNQSQDNLISDVLALEAKAALQYGDNASGWYSEKIQEALEKASQVYPEIETNPDARFAFLAALAITSQKTNVVLNTKYADEVYSYFRENGKFPQNYGKGESSKSMKNNFALLNSLIERFDNQGGISEVNNFFNTEFTVKQLTEEGFNFPVPKQEGMGETVFGSYLLGAKIGQGFYQNLNGNFDPITIDMWLMRTFGRLTGRLVGNPGAFPEQQERLFKALIERGDRELIGRMREAVEAKDTDAIIELAGDLRLEHERIFKTPEVQKAYKKNPKKWSKEEKPEWAKAAQALYDGQIKPKDSPFGSGYRKSVRRIMNKTKEKLSRDGIEVTNADLQAILWYPEKNLYAKLGAQVKDLNTDYSQAFDLLLEGREVLNEAEANQRALERGATRRGIDADARGTGRDRGEVDEAEAPPQYSIARRAELNESALIDVIKNNPDGFTVKIDGSPPPKTGFVVAPIKAAENIIESDSLNEETIQEFVRTLLATAEATGKEVYAGGWLNQDNNKYYLDAVQIYDSLDTALYVADSGAQLAIFDIGEFNEIETSEGIERLKQSGAYNSQTRDEFQRSGEESSRRFTEIRGSDRWVQLSRPRVEEQPAAQYSIARKAATVKRAPDFSETGEYIVTLGDGSTVRIFRDTEQFGYAVWHRADDLDSLTGIGYTKAEAVATLEQQYLDQQAPQYSIKRREVESKDVQKGHLSRTQSWFSRLAEDLGYSRMPADAFAIEHMITPKLRDNASIIWNGRAWPVIIHRGVNKKIEGRDKGFGLIHANRHKAEIVENTPANSVADFTEIVMSAYWPHRDEPLGQPQTRDRRDEDRVSDESKNFQLFRQENGLIKLRWNNPEWKYPSTLIFREVPFNMFPNVVSGRPELKGRGYMALVTAFPNGANKKDVTRPMESPVINPNASVAATQAANESIAGENPNPKRETLRLRKKYSLKRRYAQLPPEEKALHKKVIGGSPPDQTLGEKVLGINGLDKYNPNNPWGWRTKFRHHLVDKWASVFKTEKLVQKKRREEGLDHDIATDSAASAAFALLDRASGVISATLTVGPPIYDRGRIYAINSNSLKVSAAAGKHRDAVRADYQRAMDRLIEESAYQEIVVDPVTGEQTTRQIRWESADEVDGLLNILKPLESKGLLESFLLYSIGKRAQRLNAEGREKTLTDADIEAALAIGEKDPAIKQAHRKYQLWNNSVVNMMMDAGVISQDMATLWKENADYLPFYRELYEDAGVAYRVVSGEGTPTKDVLYKTLDDNRNNKMFQSFWQTKQPRELKGGKPVYWVMVNDVADSGRYTSRDSKQLQDRLQTLKELNPRANVRIAVDNQRIADPLNNILQNASAAVTASMQNIAVSRAIRDMLYLNLAASIPEDNREPHPNRLGVRIKGETKWFEVQDSMLVNALQATGDVNMPFLGLQAAPARFLREMVTKDPSFMAANMLRDTLSSWVTSGINVTPVVGTLKGYGDALMGTSSAKALIASGVVGGYDFKGDSKNVMRAFRKHMKLKSPVRHPFISMWNALDSISGASDSSTRIAVYNRVLKETGDETRAIVEALEVINFSRKGESKAMRYLTAVVPFLNARIQGLDVLYRGAKGDISSVDKAKRRKRFYFRALMIVSLTAAYHMAQNAGDEEDNPWYHNAPEHVKDNYWIIPPTWFGGTRDSSAFRIPIPFEVGVLFKVIPERIMQLIEGSSDGREIGRASWRHLTTTFNMSFPQWFQPAFEAMINENWHTGREIVTYWQGRNESWMANPDYASPTAIALSEALDENLALRVDAEKIDHVVRGYIGTLGSYALMLGDSISRKAIGLPERAAKSIHEEPVIGKFFQEPEGKGQLQTFYDLKTELDIFVETLNSLLEGGDLDRADRYQLSRLNLEMHRPTLEALREDITALRLFRKQLVNDRSLTPEERRDGVKGVDAQINELLHSHNIKKLRTEALRRQ